MTYYPYRGSHYKMSQAEINETKVLMARESRRMSLRNCSLSQKVKNRKIFGDDAVFDYLDEKTDGSDDV